MKKRLIITGVWMIPNVVYILYVLTLNSTNMLYHMIRKYSSVLAGIYTIVEMVIIISVYFLSTYIYGKISRKSSGKLQLEKGIITLLWIFGNFLLCFCFLWDADYFLAFFTYGIVICVPLIIKVVLHFALYKRNMSK